MAKRYGYLYQKLLDKDLISKAIDNAARDKHNYTEVQEVLDCKDFYINEVYNILLHKTYKVSPYKVKQIYEPKKRDIYILPFYPDRIIQHLLMLVLLPIWENWLSPHSYSCRKDYGQHKASQKAMSIVRKKECQYYLKCDISKFYPNLNHHILKRIVRKKIKDPDMLHLLDIIIDSGPLPTSYKIEFDTKTSDGILTLTPVDALAYVLEHKQMNRLHEVYTNTPIGNYISQWFGNLYMSEFDRWITTKVHRRVKRRVFRRGKPFIEYEDKLFVLGGLVPSDAIIGYVRYCDDFVIFGRDLEELKLIRSKIETYLLVTLKLKLSKAIINKVSKGVDFVGYRHFKKKIILRRSTAKRIIKKIKEIPNLLRHGYMNKTQALSRIGSYYGWLKHGNCFHLQIKTKLHELKKEITELNDITAIARGYKYGWIS